MKRRARFGTSVRGRLPCGLWLLLAGLLLSVAAQAGGVKVRAFLDRTHAQLGGTVTLNVEVDGATEPTTPDVSALSTDFVILGRSHTNSIRIVNGHRSMKTLWAVQLRPRHAGTLTIPSLHVHGQNTAPLTLTVGAAPATSQGGPGDPVFIKVQANTLTPYVGQQVALTVRLFYSPNVDNGSIDMPHPNGVELRQLGKATRFQVQRGSHFYHVLEKHYAVISHHTGSVNLAPVRFQGSMAEPGGFANFFGQGRPVTARSQGIHLTVRPRPSSSGKGAWLPARKLSLALTGWPTDGRIQVGQPLTLTLTEKAVGLPFESLPKLQLPKFKGVNIYPDQPHKHTDDSGRWLVGARTRKFALVASTPGRVTLPAITLRWWNVKTGKAEVARIPAHALQVVAAAGQTVVQTPPASAASAHAAPPAVASAGTVAPRSTIAAPASPSLPSRASGHVWAWAALGLWLATVLAAGGWWWYRRRRIAPVAPSAMSAPREVIKKPDRRYQRQAFFQVVRDGEVTAQCSTLLAWARAERPSLHHLGELAAALQRGAQTDAIAGLQRARYAPGVSGPTTDTLLAAFEKGFAWRDPPSTATSDSALPPLYPPS